jgi:hypothetical protein
MPWARSSDRGIWIGLGWAAVISLIAVCAVRRYKTVWTNGASTKQMLSQASVMIGTFITLYTVMPSRHGLRNGGILSLPDATVARRGSA